MKEKYYSQELLEGIARENLAPNYEPFPVIIERGDGCSVYDINGKRYLDMLSCYSALNLGHGYFRITRALIGQLYKLAVSPRKYYSKQLILFAKELAEFCGMEMVLPMLSGAEAVETAIKLSRKWAYTRKGVPLNEAEIIVCDNNFHGRTTTIISFSSVPQYKDLFGPHTPGFKSVPFGDAEALRKAITPNTAAFLVEPIQGEGGIVVPPEGYLSVCREICRENNVLFIADEIQTGLGRTGKMFACDHENVKPDIFILGKALGGGVLPISAVVSSRDILTVFEPGDHGSTFGGNPLACRTARETLRALRDKGLDQRAAEMGNYLQESLRALNSSYIKEVRGKGLLIGVELADDGMTAHDFCKLLINEGILCSDTKEYVIRFAPPLTIRKNELDWFLERAESVFSDMF